MYKINFEYTENEWVYTYTVEFEAWPKGDDFEVDLLSIQDNQGRYLVENGPEINNQATEAALEWCRANFDLDAYYLEQWEIMTAGEWA